ncbi:HPr family phosphocarrier protein [Faecalicatena contorta]|uniref:HPr family phosphocarrier protein n=1 Tax=Faecalicatena contorta TaxID=39482 RepID=UPI001F318152|nr:HPr family phosphocarrier protein [Faecalicatena contorta]MCF2682048.1 HPr family phosphocarrier protein [Faecalicatena contorta]
MVKKNILLNSIDRVKVFVNTVSKIDCDMDLAAGRYIVDAKSIMGIFSIDISKPIELRIHASDEEAEKIIESLKEYIQE